MLIDDFHILHGFAATESLNERNEIDLGFVEFFGAATEIKGSPKELRSKTRVSLAFFLGELLSDGRRISRRNIVKK